MPIEITPRQLETSQFKRTEVLNKITQDLRLVSENLWKEHNRYNKQDKKAHWDKICSNLSAWNPRRESLTDII